MSVPARWAVSILVLAGSFGLAPAAEAQDLHPSRRLSPVGIARTHIGDTYVKVTYGRPYMRDRAIFGPAGDTIEYLVPFGRLWRTGANEATEITLTGPLMVAGQHLPAGTYSVFTEPGPTTWTVRFSPQLGLNGTARIGPEGMQPNAYDPEHDVLVIQAQTRALDEEVDQLTFTFEPTDAGADLLLQWERTEVRIPLAAPR